MKQVVTIGPDGTISGLLHKKGQGFDPRVLGKAQIERASEVVWLDMEQAWVVEFRSGAGRWAGAVLDQAVLMVADLGFETGTVPFDFKGFAWDAYGRVHQQGDHGVLLFENYEDGVKAEIAVLDALRLKGLLEP